jgi:hypothetical protein
MAIGKGERNGKPDVRSLLSDQLFTTEKTSKRNGCVPHTPAYTSRNTHQSLIRNTQASSLRTPSTGTDSTHLVG